MNILLIGGSSRLGTAMRRLWTAHQVTAPTRAECDPTRVEDVQRVMANIHPDIIVNCVAYNNVDGAEGDGKVDANTLNVQVPTILAQCAQASNTRLIHISTDYVFNGESDHPYTETDATDPINEYGKTKLAGEQAVLAMNPDFQVIRTARLYGAMAESAQAKKSFVDIVKELSAQQSEFTINDGEVGSPTWVDDLTRHIEAHAFPDDAPRGILHMTNEGGATWFEWAQEIVRLWGCSATVLPRDPRLNPRPAKRPAYSVLTATRTPKMRDWKEALADYQRMSA